MIYEFNGKTEKEAIDKAISEIGMEREKFDIEILENEKKGLFKKGNVKIRVHVRDEINFLKSHVEPETDFDHDIVAFIKTLVEKMGFPATVKILSKQENKIYLTLESEYSSILIGKRGKNLDAIQVLANVFSGKVTKGSWKIVVDSENYRTRREESIIRMARKFADQVKKTRRSRLLEPMNPFERRLIHTTLNDIYGVSTKSEGDGLYKQIRISCENDAQPEHSY